MYVKKHCIFSRSSKKYSLPSLCRIEHLFQVFPVFLKTIPGSGTLSELCWEGAFEVDGFADELDCFLEVEGLMLSWVSQCKMLKSSSNLGGVNAIYEEIVNFDIGRLT